MEQAERDALLDELRQKHGDIDAFYLEGELMVLAKPKASMEWDRYQNALTAIAAGREVDAADATRTFVLACVVHPTIEEARALFKRFPGAPSDLMRRCTALVKAKIVELKNV